MNGERALRSLWGRVACTVFTGMIFVCAVQAEESPLATVRILDEERTTEELTDYLTALVPEFDMPASGDAWEKTSDELRQRLLKEIILRGVPDAWSDFQTKIVWGERIPGDGYSIRKLRYEILPDFWLGALLYEPEKLEGKVPAILNVNGHAGEGMCLPYKQQRCINQAKRGMVALNLEWMGLGQLRGPEYSHNHSAYLDLCGRSGLSIFYFALKHGLDILCDHENADPERVAVTGLSGGGWQTIFISALDTRVRLAAPNAGYIGIAKRLQVPGDMGDIEQCPSDFHRVADYVHLTGMLAPRPSLLIYNVRDDCCFQSDRARLSVYEPIVPLYKLFGYDERRFAYHENLDPGTHNYLLDNQKALYRFLNEHFLDGKGNDDDLSRPDEILDEAALAVEYPEKCANFISLAEEQMASLPERRLPKYPEKQPRWRTRTRKRLKRLIRFDESYTIEMAEAADAPAAKEALADLGAKARVLRLGDDWTLPMLSFRPTEGDPAGTVLLLADFQKPETFGCVRENLEKRRRVILLNIFYVGECVATGRRYHQPAMLTATLGKRALGIQVAQLTPVLEKLRERYEGDLTVVADGRVAGMAALMTLALKPGAADRLVLNGMEESLKDLLTDKIGYNDAAPLFCFGLLARADVSELIDLAQPTVVERLP